MDKRFIFHKLCIISIFSIILAFTNFIYKSGAVGGIDPGYSMQDGYDIWNGGYEVWGWPGSLYFTGHLKLNNEISGCQTLILVGLDSFWFNKDWIIGTARSNEQGKGFFAVKKVDISNQNFSDYSEVEEYLEKKVYFPLETIDDISAIVGFDANKIVLSKEMPLERGVHYPSVRKLYLRKLIVIFSLGFFSLIGPLNILNFFSKVIFKNKNNK